MLRITRLNAYSVFHHITDQSGVLQLMLQGLDKILRNLRAHPPLMIWIWRLLKTFANAGLTSQGIKVNHLTQEQLLNDAEALIDGNVTLCCPGFTRYPEGPWTTSCSGGSCF